MGENSRRWQEAGAREVGNPQMPTWKLLLGRRGSVKRGQDCTLDDEQPYAGVSDKRDQVQLMPERFRRARRGWKPGKAGKAIGVRQAGDRGPPLERGWWTRTDRHSHLSKGAKQATGDYPLGRGWRSRAQ